MNPTRPRAWLLDTCILVHLLRGKAAGRHIDTTYGLAAAKLRPLICVVTVGECMALARYNNWGASRQQSLQQLLEELVHVDIDHPRVLGSYAEIEATARAAGKTPGKNDVWIAAASVAAQAEVLTCDKDFLHLPSGLIQVTYIDPASLPTGP